MELLCYVLVNGNAPGKRMGIVKWYEKGYFHCDYDLPSYTTEQLVEYVHTLNARLEIPDEVAQSALYGSMFGWHVPAAERAVAFYKALQQEKQVSK